MSHPSVPTEVERVELEEAKRLYDAGTALFVDVRSPEDYARAHIPGARLLPVGEVPTRYDELPRDRDLIPY